MTWTLESLAEWGRNHGFRARASTHAVLFSARGDRRTLFSISLRNLDPGFAAEIAFSTTHPQGAAALRELASTLPSATPKSAWKWSRLGLATHDGAVLDRLARWSGADGPARRARPEPSGASAAPRRKGADTRAPANAPPAPDPTKRRPPAEPAAAAAAPYSGARRRKPASMAGLEALGRVRLSKSFFLRDFLYSEIAALNGFRNVPEYPDVAIEAGRGLCEQLLEPLQDRFGRLAIRSAYRSSEVNAFGNANGLNCSSNEHSHGRHIWDHRDARGCLGATACIVVPAFLDYYQRTGHWEALAWWIHDHLPYSRMEFYPKLAAFNLTWSEQPEGRIASRAPPRLGVLTMPGHANFAGDHSDAYRDWLATL